MAAMNLYQNSSPFLGMLALWMLKAGCFRVPAIDHSVLLLYRGSKHNNKNGYNVPRSSLLNEASTIERCHKMIPTKT